MGNPRVGEASMETMTSSDAATDLRYALDVMEEYSHLGLDDEYTGKLRRILLRRIGEAGPYRWFRVRALVFEQVIQLFRKVLFYYDLAPDLSVGGLVDDDGAQCRFFLYPHFSLSPLTE
jgi:hypothetical protein